MPEALATTKRKFHKLLDSRFGSPSAPAATPPRPVSQGTISEPATKRIRSSGSTTSLAASLRSKTLPKTSINPIRGEPNFAPWSHDAFIKRLRSFGPVTSWHPKPDAVNEVEWAKRGWWCVDTNTVACKGGCQRRLVVKVEPIAKRHRVQTEEEDQEQEEEDEDDNQEDLERALVDKYKELIVEGHSDDCLWRKAGCKDDIYRLPIVKSTVWQPELRTRYQSLLNIAPSLANLTLQPAELDPSPDKILANLPTAPLDKSEDKPDENDASEDTDATEETKQKALKIALCGWQGSTESSTQLLACEACFQRIGLWMYQPDYKPHRFDDDDEDEQEDRYLDLIQLHREHCPWRNPATQAATGNYTGKSAHGILLDVLDRYIDEQRRRSRGTIQGPTATGDEVESDAGATDDGRESLAVETMPSMPELSRAETEKHDKERLSKLRRLKTVLGFKKRAPPAV
ncbi:unnamed protein product [Aureobasidium uvarum]|uniref:Zf-C3HC-domain-containing protein n=1 Tax=Aureobasidium uvarum TaxID=2773716 RepID=A0A9N8KWW7_9PEZI|nr:unnamed protein product [Aureobasidium uvarum]